MPARSPIPQGRPSTGVMANVPTEPHSAPCKSVFINRYCVTQQIDVLPTTTNEAQNGHEVPFSGA
jgi:hypothetical protein